MRQICECMCDWCSYRSASAQSDVIDYAKIVLMPYVESVTPDQSYVDSVTPDQSYVDSVTPDQSYVDSVTPDQSIFTV